MDTIINILGFVAGLLTGIIAIFVGIRTPPQAWQIAFGVWTLVSVVLAWWLMLLWLLSLDNRSLDSLSS